MQYVALPMRICNSLDRIDRNFLWGSTNTRRKLHLVKCSRIAKSTGKGGFGPQSTHPRNLALLTKLCWRLLKNKGDNWAKLLWAKYIRGDVWTTFSQNNNRKSSTQACLKQGWSILQKGVRWVIRRGNDISLWTNNWSGMGALRNLIHGPLRRNEDLLLVKDILMRGGNWDFSIISFAIPRSFELLCKAINVPLHLNLEDDWVWGFSSNGDFCFKSAYKIALGENPNHQAADSFNGLGYPHPS